MARLGRADLLGTIFGRIHIPRQVLGECIHPGAPVELRDSFSPELPDFVEVVEVEQVLPSTKSLDPGEAAAITYALAFLPGVLVLLDEKRGRAIAASLGLPMKGLLGIVVEAHRRGLLEFEPTVAALRRTGFRISDSILAETRRVLDL